MNIDNKKSKLLCPVCNTEYQKTDIEQCYICNWNLKLSTETLSESNKSQLFWAKEMWLKFQLQQKQSHISESRLKEIEVENARLEGEISYRLEKLEKTQPTYEPIFVTSTELSGSQKISELENQLQKVQEQLKETQREQKKLQSELDKLFQEIKKNKSPGSSNIIDDSSIVSQSGIDYTRVRNSLLAGEWEKANAETNLIIEILWRTHKTPLSNNETNQDDEEIIERTACNIPCEDLQIIDSLWLRYSHGKFGLSVQKNIYDDCEKTLDPSRLNIFETFICYRMFWYSEGYDKYTQSPNGEFRRTTYNTDSNFFQIQTHIKGSFPRISWVGYLSKEQKWAGMNSYLELLERLFECKNKKIHDTKNK